MSKIHIATIKRCFLVLVFVFFTGVVSISFASLKCAPVTIVGYHAQNGGGLLGHNIDKKKVGSLSVATKQRLFGIRCKLNCTMIWGAIDQRLAKGSTVNFAKAKPSFSAARADVLLTLCTRDGFH